MRRILVTMPYLIVYSVGLLLRSIIALCILAVLTLVIPVRGPQPSVLSFVTIGVMIGAWLSWDALPPLVPRATKLMARLLVAAATAGWLWVGLVNWFRRPTSAYVLSEDALIWAFTVGFSLLRGRRAEVRVVDVK